MRRKMRRIAALSLADLPDILKNQIIHIFILVQAHISLLLRNGISPLIYAGEDDSLQKNFRRKGKIILDTGINLSNLQYTIDKSMQM